MHRVVTEFCRCCGACQKFRTRKPAWVPLVPLPVVEEPFRRVAMDIVGTLPRSRSGNRYVLVFCDYATRYPEAVPVKTIDAETVAEELVQIFARVGIPQEIPDGPGLQFLVTASRSSTAFSMSMPFAPVLTTLRRMGWLNASTRP